MSYKRIIFIEIGGFIALFIRRIEMLKSVRWMFVTLLAGLLFLAACGGSTTSTGGDAGGSSEVSGAGPTASGPSLAKVSPVDGPAARGQAGPTSDAAAVCLTPAEADLARQINEYRASVGLPALPVSKSLTLVAQQHVWDSVNNPSAEPCNMHSWSGNVNPALQQGTWTAVCYTDDHANAAGMWRKPRELAGYPADGYENSHWASDGASPSSALNGWRNSPGHNAVITEQNGWGPFLALGVGISGQYAHMWVGEVADPAGVAEVCGGGAAVQPTAPPEATSAPPTAVPPTAIPLPTTAPVDNAATGEILNQTGVVAAGGDVEHTFEVAPGRRYTTVVSPSGEFDAMLAYRCTAGTSSSGTVDSGWEGEAESFAYVASAAGACTVTVSGYEGSNGPYTIVVTAQ
jgi:hypothetical protein